MLRHRADTIASQFCSHVEQAEAPLRRRGLTFPHLQLLSAGGAPLLALFEKWATVQPTPIGFPFHNRWTVRSVTAQAPRVLAQARRRRKPATSSTRRNISGRSDSVTRTTTSTYGLSTSTLRNCAACTAIR